MVVFPQLNATPHWLKLSVPDDKGSADLSVKDLPFFRGIVSGPKIPILLFLPPSVISHVGITEELQTDFLVPGGNYVTVCFSAC